MKKYYFLIIVSLILGLVLTGCTLLSNIGQVPTSEQSGIAYLTKNGILDPNLVGLWHFNGNSTDSSGNGNNGTVYGAAFVAGKYGQALSFDGNDYVEVSNSPSIEFLGKSNITMEAWVYPESYHATNRSIILEHIAQYYLTIDKNGKLAVYFYGVSPAGYYVSTLQVPLDTWTHIAATYNGSSVQLYINGALSGSTSASGTISYASGWSNQPLRMGYERPDLTRYFQGIIDEARIWNVALSQDQLGKVYEFDGFFSPIENLPKWNAAKAGRAIPVKFSLSGDQGLDIFEPGYPKSVELHCDGAPDPEATIEGTDTAGGSILNYDATTGQYIYVWKTDKIWADECRQLVVRLNDGTSHVANFTFK